MKKYCLGGSIAVGKTTILNKIKNSIEIDGFYKKILISEEFDVDSDIMKDIMDSTYNKDKVLFDELIQLYTQFNRWSAYIKNINYAIKKDYSMVFFDRGPLDPLVFAMLSIKDEKQKQLLVEYSINLLKKIFEKYGKPDLYFILSIKDINIINRRIQERNRIEEIKNSDNLFIDNLNRKFPELLKDLCNKLNVTYKEIDASKKFNDVYSDIINEVKRNENV